MGLSIFRWAVIIGNETKIVCAETIDDVLEKCDYPQQPNAVIRLGFAEWDEEAQDYH